MYPSRMPDADDMFVWDMWLSSYQLAAMTVGDEIGLFRNLKDEALTIGELADRLGIGFRAAEALTSPLLAIELLKTTSGRLSLTSKSEAYLLPDSPFYRGDSLIFNRNRYPHTLLSKAVGEGENPSAMRDIWKDSATPELGRQFADVMRGMLILPTMSAVESGIFDSVGRLLDAGGGAGCTAAEFVRAYPDRHAAICDVPIICEAIREYLRDRKIDGDIRFHPRDFPNEPLPEGYDGLCFDNVFHDIPPERCRKLAASAFEAAVPGAKIFVHEMLMNDERTGPVTVACYDVAKFAKLSSRQFSRKELSEMLSDAGFRNITTKPTFGYFSMMIAEKPGT